MTRARILDTALALFLEKGYEHTTMRAVAERAEVALGNAYYYFESKDHLIQAFYGLTHDAHLAMAQPLLAEPRPFRDRLLDVMRAKLETIEPYHEFSAALFKTAADPASPLNPFSQASRDVREQSTALFRQVVDGSTTRMPSDLRAELPGLLWVYHMGIVLYWIHDQSPDRRKSYRLVENTVGLIDQLIMLARLPLMGRIRASVLRMIAESQA